MRKLKLLLVLCMVAIAASASKTVYLAPGSWDADNATERYALYMYNDTQNAWVDFTKGTDGFWSAQFDEQYTNMIICRMDASNSTNAWNDGGGTVWNQTANMDAPFADGLTYRITATGDSPAFDIVAYIQNPETGLFLSRGKDWGTHAVAAPAGLPWKIEYSDGTYKLKMYDINKQNSNDTGLGFGTNSYADSGDLAGFTLAGDDTNGYTLKNGDNYIKCPAAAGIVELTATASIWKFLSQSQYNAVLAARATTQETQIATLKGITIPDGSSLSEVVGDANNWMVSTVNDGVPTAENWTATKVRDGDNHKNNWGNYGSEMFQCGAAHYTRTIEGLKQGVYKVSVRAMKRVGTNDNCYALGKAGFSVSDSYVDANGYIIPIKAWSDDCVSNANPNSPTDFVTIVNNGGYTTDGFVYVGSDGKLTVDVTSEAFWWGGWFLFNGISYTYYNNEVSDADAATVLSQAETLEGTPMLAATKTALTSAKTTFSGAKTIANYNTLGQAIADAQASADIYAALGAALTDATAKKATCVANDATYTATFDSNIAAITTEYNNGNIAEADIATKVAEVQAEVILLVKSQTKAGSDMTLAVTNAAGTAAVGADNWQLENALASGEKFQLDTWAGTASGMSVPMIEYWITKGNTLSTNVIYQTITGLQEGVYTVTATTAVNNESNVAPNAGSALLFANDATTDITSGATETNFKGQTGTFTVQGVVASDGNLKIGFKTVSPNYNWIAFKNVKLTFDGAAASEAEKQAFTTAYYAVKDNVIGFEADEYAPYNNVDAIKALASAQAIVVETAAKDEIVAATNALNAATWTKNTAELNAVYDGTFASATNDGAPLGWTMSNNTLGGSYHSRAFVGDTRLSEFNTTNSGLFLRFDGTNSNRGSQYYYGNTVGYTMPLKANTSYIVMVDFTNWGTTDSKPLRLNVDGPNSFNVNQELTSVKNADSGSDTPDQFNMVFTTNEAGDYVLRFQVPGNDDNKHNVVISNVVLRKAVPVYAVVGSKKGDDNDKAIFSSGWDQATQIDILSKESEGVYSKTYTAQELAAQTIVYKVIKKGDIEAKTALAWYPDENQEVAFPVKGIYDIKFTFTEEGSVVTGVATKTAEAVTITAAGWATTVTNSPLNFDGSGVEAYTAKVNEKKVSMTKVDNVQAETGLVLKGAEGTYFIPVIASSETDKGDLMFSSTLPYNIWQPDASEGKVNTFYGLKVSNNEAKFAKLNFDNGTAIPAGKAFLLVQTPASSSARESLDMDFSDDITGINTVAVEKNVEGIYNLNGQRVDAPVRGGLYIVNGKKVVLK